MGLRGKWLLWAPDEAAREAWRIMDEAQGDRTVRWGM